MADEKHLLLTINGGYTDGGLAAEQWQTGLRLALVFGSVDDIGTLPNNWAPEAHTISRTEATWTISGNWRLHGPSTSVWNPDDYLNDQVAPAVATWMAFTNQSTAVRADTIKLAVVGAPLGKEVAAPPYAVGSPCLLTYTSGNPTGGDGGTLLPLQDSVVASHYTSQLGRRGRGRMFLPPSSSSSVAGGRLTTTARDHIRDGQVAFLEALAVSPIDPTNLHIRPIVTGKPFVNYSVIDEVKVGRVIDTQRRRRRSLDELRSSAPVSY
jgi:hypothetical protein